MYLERINSPADVKALPADALPQLCQEIRRAIVESSAVVGGHVGSNLAVVELTVALHRVFSSPEDKLVFDVSHQTYAHKMLTGRASNYLDAANYGGLSGFSSPSESEHDLFSMGHTSTSVSLACGLAKARDLDGEAHNVVAVIGDGSLSGGLAFEGLNNAADVQGNLIIIVNDNEWSIAPNQGGLYRGLAELRRTNGAASNNIFKALGLEYRYLADGHDAQALEAALAELRGCDHPVVLHVLTQKGAGYAPAEADAETWHHIPPFDAATGEVAKASATESYAEITGSYLLERMAEDRGIVAVSAATPYIMGFSPKRRAQADDQFVDVGIAEEHAVTYAAALARAGAKPVLGIYATFLQRAYDELWHDLCLNAAPAVLLVFGSSAYGTTDATHLGFFDIPMLGDMPGLTYLAPTCREEYLDMLSWALAQTEGPVAIRVPGAGVVSRPDTPLAGSYGNGKAVVERKGSDVAILALGDIYPLGERVADALRERGIDATLVNPRFATHPDKMLLDDLSETHRLFVTLEDGVLDGGFGERCSRVLGTRGGIRTRCYGLPKAFPDRYDPDMLLTKCGLRTETLVSDILEMLSA